MPGLTVYRPGGTRLVAYGVIVVIAVVAAVIAEAMPSSVHFTGPQVVTLLLIYLAIAVGMHGIGRSFVRVGPEGLDILNGYRYHEVAWEQMKGVSMNLGAPWPTLVLNDDERVMLFAIQGSNGAPARRAVEELARDIARGGPA